MLRREHHAGVRITAYLASKVALLMPILLVVNAAMLLVLAALQRLPDAQPHALVDLYITTGLDAFVALCLGLTASAAVTTTAQAALALPMLCFPAVLFSGAVVPLAVMPSAGRMIAAVMSDRWAFEAIAHHLHIASIAGPGSPYATLGASGSLTYWLLLIAFASVLIATAAIAVRHRAVRELS